MTGSRADIISRLQRDILPLQGFKPASTGYGENPGLGPIRFSFPKATFPLNTVHEFIKSVRLRKSVKLLLEGRLSITQVAFEVGFSSRSYFDRCFVKQYKLAPREYVNNYLPGKNKKK